MSAAFLFLIACTQQGTEHDGRGTAVAEDQGEATSDSDGRIPGAWEFPAGDSDTGMSTTTQPPEPCDPSTAFTRITGEHDLGVVSWAQMTPPTDEEFGWDVAAFGDATGDGLGDVGIVAPQRETLGNRGGVDLIPSPLVSGASAPAGVGVQVFDGTPGALAAWLPASEHSMRALADQTGDALPEIVLANPVGPDFGSGIVYILSSPIGAPATTVDLDSAWATFAWAADWDQVGFGEALSTVDFSADGQPDLLVAAAGATTDMGGVTGRGYLFEGPFSAGSWTEADAAVQVMPATEPVAVGDLGIPVYGGSQAIGQDLDGDGIADLTLTAPISDKEHLLDEAGGAWIWQGPLTADVFASDAVAVLWGNTSLEALGVIADSLGDTDGDGYGEIGLSSTGGPYPGGIGHGWVVNSLPAGTVDVGDVATTDIHGLAYGDSAAFIHGMGDIDGDGFDDVAVGALGVDGDVRSATALFYGPLVAGDDPITSADAILWGEVNYSAAVRATNAGDMDGDCIPDLAVGAPYHNTVYIVAAGQVGP